MACEGDEKSPLLERWCLRWSKAEFHDQIMVVCTAIIAVCTAIYTGFGGVQMCTMNRQANQTDSSLAIAEKTRVFDSLETVEHDSLDKVKERGRIVIVPDKNGMWITPDPSRKGYSRVTPFIKIENIGKTAVENIRFHATFTVQSKVDKPMYFSWEDSISKHKADWAWMLIPSFPDLMPSEVYIRKDADLESQRFSVDSISQLHAGFCLLRYCGFIEYKDVFGDKWVKKFRWSVMYTDINNTWVNLVVPTQDSEEKFIDPLDSGRLSDIK